MKQYLPNPDPNYTWALKRTTPRPRVHSLSNVGGHSYSHWSLHKLGHDSPLAARSADVLN